MFPDLMFYVILQTFVRSQPNGHTNV